MFPVSVWLRTGASLDNAVHAAGEELDTDGQVRLQSIREAGWAANAAHPNCGDGFGSWPPNDAELSVPLSESDSESIREILDQDLSVHRGIAERDPGLADENIALISEARRCIS
jgi:hypothetical protein